MAFQQEGKELMSEHEGMVCMDAGQPSMRYNDVTLDRHGRGFVRHYNPRGLRFWIEMLSL